MHVCMHACVHACVRTCVCLLQCKEHADLCSCHSVGEIHGAAVRLCPGDGQEFRLPLLCRMLRGEANETMGKTVQVHVFQKPCYSTKRFPM